MQCVPDQTVIVKDASIMLEVHGKQVVWRDHEGSRGLNESPREAVSRLESWAQSRGLEVIHV